MFKPFNVYLYKYVMNEDYLSRVLRHQSKYSTLINTDLCRITLLNWFSSMVKIF